MYTIGDEVRYKITGQIGIVKNVIYYEEANDVFMYEVELNGVLYLVEEMELN